MFPKIRIVKFSSNSFQAAGLGHYEIADYMLDKYPEGTQIIDNDGRTALHWSILAKDKDQIYNDLVEHGAKESTLDNVSNKSLKQITPIV